MQAPLFTNSYLHISKTGDTFFAFTNIQYATLFNSRPMLLNCSPYYISLISPAGNEKRRIVAVLQQKTIPKGTCLLQAGQICRYIYFVNYGCLRTFYLNESGVEQNVLLHPENWWVSDLASFSGKRKSKYNIGALEKTEVIFFSHEQLEQLFTEIPKLESFFRILYQNALVFYQNRLLTILTQSAEERFRIFRKLYPHLEQRIPQKHIASLLGMTPVFLSMLRKRHLP
ncbi:cAMP-binding domain of CRP or a regulatory subunit of cAMP-dependent protein kinases [Filimonas lacunae]|uniref:cAMP-binding domain of CRP or a regulatory subunit of cAMP-dependent protein kinases n=2 Tax=Filimonas lacunae TaxID=477680 RepID=A0A1N7REU1_9BACT|nr:cAMP-binding domain of CRP or a regulatory subunit of cAMP-dependent protein kinases [Filimonas lacunae]